MFKEHLITSCCESSLLNGEKILSLQKFKMFNYGFFFNETRRTFP
jgi:hypothetical protein